MVDKHKYKWEDYTMEYCPFCENEVVVYSNCVTACPYCGRPLAPCSMCEECVDDCPYGCDGVHDEEKQIDKYITADEIAWYIAIDKDIVPIRAFKDVDEEVADEDEEDKMLYFWMLREDLQRYIGEMDVSDFLVSYSAEDTVTLFLNALDNDDIIYWG